MRQRCSVHVACEPSTVLGFLETPENLPRWVDAVDRVDRVEDAGGAEGRRFRQRVAVAKEPSWFPGRVDRETAPERVVFTMEAPERTVEVAFETTPVEDGTRLDQVVEMPLDGWATKVLAPILWVTNRRRMQAQLDRLKRELEQETAREAPPA